MSITLADLKISKYIPGHHRNRNISTGCLGGHAVGALVETDMEGTG